MTVLKGQSSAPRRGGPRGPGVKKVESAKPTPKKAKVALSRVASKSKPAWTPLEQLYQPGGTTITLSTVTSEFHSLKSEHRYQRNVLLVSLYEIACHVRDNADAFDELCRHEDWNKNEKLRPKADDQANALRHVFRLAAGLTGVTANDRSSRWTRALAPAFTARLDPPAVMNLIATSGGIKKLASKNKTSGEQPEDAGQAIPPMAEKGRGNIKTDEHRSGTEMAASYVKLLRDLEKIVISHFLADYAGLTPVQEGNQRQFLRRLLADRIHRLALGNDPAGCLLEIFEPVLRT